MTANDLLYDSMDFSQFPVVEITENYPNLARMIQHREHIKDRNPEYAAHLEKIILLLRNFVNYREFLLNHPYKSYLKTDVVANLKTQLEQIQQASDPLFEKKIDRLKNLLRNDILIRPVEESEPNPKYKWRDVLFENMSFMPAAPLHPIDPDIKRLRDLVRAYQTDCKEKENIDCMTVKKEEILNLQSKLNARKETESIMAERKEWLKKGGRTKRQKRQRRKKSRNKFKRISRAS